MGTIRRKVHDHQEACELLDRLDKSGLRLPDFCALHGIDGRSLNCWRRNLSGRQAAEPRPLRLLEIVPTGSSQTRSSTASYRLWIGDFTVEIDDNFDEDTLARLLQVVARC